jgi:hypothetical protein
METLNIVKLINDSNSATILSEKYSAKLLTKIKENFTISQQQMYVANFYCFLNHDSDKDFIINFDNVWKWVGFTRKDNGKKLLEKFFKLDIDYKIVFLRLEENLLGGRPSETIMITINTFKKFCLKAGTKKADEVHDYYIKLEKLLNETVNEQTNQLMKQLDYQTKYHLSEMEKMKKKLEKKKKVKYELTHSLYIISNPFFKGYYKIGKSSSINNRMDNYVSGSPVDYKIEYLCKVRNKTEETIVENMVLQILTSYTVKNHLDNDREWVFGLDLEIIKKEMNDCVEYLNIRREKYNILYENNKKEDEEHNTIEDSEEEIKDSIEEDDSKSEKKSEEIDEESKKNEEDDLTSEKKLEEIDEESEENEEEVKTNQKYICKYDFDLSTIGIKRNDPIDFEQFIIDFCDLGENLYEIQTDLRCGFKIWSRCELDSVQKQFDEYMNQKFQDTRIFLDNQRRHVYKGIKLKPLKYKKTNMNFDFEEFIYKKCEINHLYRISYNDFFHYFILWKKETDPSFELKRPDSVKIKEILELSFAKARIQHSVNSKTKNLWGLLGIGMIENNFGQIDRKRQNKKVGEFDLSTNNLLKEYDSIYCASQILKIPFSTFGNYIRTRTVVKGKYYKLL